MVWAPSHGKQKGKYIPPNGFDEKRLRALNKGADDEAPVHLATAITELCRGAWYQEIAEAEERAHQAITIVALSTQRFFDFDPAALVTSSGESPEGPSGTKS